MAPLGISFTTLLMNFCKELKRQKKQFLIFWDSKTGVEKFAWRASKQGIQIEPHRAGLKANERKEIESKLKSRQLDGLICTPTLELGIDIGSLEVVFSILVPWSKFKQRMGRAGRRDAPGYGFLILGDDPVSEWFKKYPEDFKNEHIVHINPKNKRVSNFMIPFRVLNTNKLQNNLIKKDEKIFRENISVFKQKELFLETNDFVEGNRGGIQLHLKKYNIRGMGDEVKVFQKPLKGSKQTFDIKNQIGTETTPLAYQKFHIGAIYMHRKKVFRIIETHLLPNDEDADRYVIVESVPNPKYYTTPTVDKSPTIPSDSQFSETIIGGIRIKLTDLDIDKTIRGYKRFSIYDDTPFEDLIDNDVRVVVPRDGLSPYVSNTATDLNNPMIGSDEEDVDKRDDRKQEKEFSVNLENNDLPNYYKILGVQPDSTLENIKKNFRELAKKTHPDKTKEDSLQKMKRINQAYDTLSNKESREKYDKTIRGYKRFSIYDDTPSEDLIDNDVRAVVTRGRSTPHYVSDIELDTNHPVIDCNGEEFTFSTRGIVLDIPIQEKDTSQVGDKIYEVKQEILDGLHVIEHVLQHAGVTIANISHENLDGIYDNSTKSTEFKKIYVYDDSGDGESGAVEAIFYNIEKVILRAFEMLSLCEGPKNNICDEPSGCSKCSFLMLKCSQFNEHLYKPEAVKILEKIVNSIFEDKLETFKHQKWNDLKESDEFLKVLEKKFGHLIPNVSEQISELKNYHF